MLSMNIRTLPRLFCGNCGVELDGDDFSSMIRDNRDWMRALHPKGTGCPFDGGVSQVWPSREPLVQLFCDARLIDRLGGNESGNESRSGAPIHPPQSCMVAIPKVMGNSETGFYPGLGKTCCVPSCDRRPAGMICEKERQEIAASAPEVASST